MNFPSELRYTQEHEWIKIIDANTALIGITDFAQSELGDIVYVEIETLDETIASNEIFGSIEAVKTVSDLFMPVNGKIIEVNGDLNDSPENVNNDPYGAGWLIKIEVENMSEIETLLDVEAYKSLIGQ
jgi:glycine cleavage system H protein